MRNKFLRYRYLKYLWVDIATPDVDVATKTSIPQLLLFLPALDRISVRVWLSAPSQYRIITDKLTWVPVISALPHLCNLRVYVMFYSDRHDNIATEMDALLDHANVLPTVSLKIATTRIYKRRFRF